MFVLDDLHFILDVLDVLDGLDLLDLLDFLDLAKVCSEKISLYRITLLQWLNDFPFTIYRGRNAPEL